MSWKKYFLGENEDCSSIDMPCVTVWAAIIGIIIIALTGVVILGLALSHRL